MRREVENGLHFGRIDRPDSTQIVFVHGVMDRGATFLTVTRRLQSESWLVYDRRGYGRSTCSYVPTFLDHVDDLVAILTAEANQRPVVVVGHSLGGTIALAAASRVPESVSAAIIHEAPLPWLDWWPLRDQEGRKIEDDTPIDAVTRVMERTAGKDVWESLSESVRAQRFSEGPTMVSELVTVRESCPFSPTQFRMPVVVSRGTESVGVRERAQQWLVKTLPTAEPWLIDGAAHNVQSTHPGAFANLVTEVAKRVKSDRSS